MQRVSPLEQGDGSILPALWPGQAELRGAQSYEWGWQEHRPMIGPNPHDPGRSLLATRARGTKARAKPRVQRRWSLGMRRRLHPRCGNAQQQQCRLWGTDPAQGSAGAHRDAGEPACRPGYFGWADPPCPPKGTFVSTSGYLLPCGPPCATSFALSSWAFDIF